jgi:hypothetical protein
VKQIQNHPTAAELAAFCRGELPEVNISAIAEHLERCEKCCAALSSVPDDEFIRLARTAGSLRAEVPDCRHTGKVEVNDVPALLATLKRYDVEEQIGHGGMGEVYWAQHKLMQRAVALKVINPKLVGNPEAISRFRNEVRAAASLSHPNIVSSFDAENVGDLHFLVMELVDGTSLSNVVHQNGPLGWAEALDLVEQAASGLEAAFNKDMVHRDIKPQNLMLTRDGVVKILDFGLARIQRQSIEENPSPVPETVEDHEAEALIDTSAGITGTNLAIGTPDYLSPEQARDATQADTRSDIYSLGCTLRFLLTGAAPFPGGNSLEKISNHLLGQPEDIRVLCEDTPEEVASLLDRMMDKDPAARFQTPNELLCSIAEVKRQAGLAVDSSVEKSSAANRRWFFAACIACFAFAAIGCAVWMLSPPPEMNVLVVAPKRTYYPDYEVVKREFDRRGVAMTVAAFEKTIEPVGDAVFEPFDADLLFREVQVGNYDAIVFIGGGEIEHLTAGIASNEVNRIISEARSQSVTLGGICVGLNVLQNCNVTEVQEMLADATDERLMTFDGIVTAVDNADVEAFVGRLLSQ